MISQIIIFSKIDFICFISIQFKHFTYFFITKHISFM